MEGNLEALLLLLSAKLCFGFGQLASGVHHGVEGLWGNGDCSMSFGAILMIFGDAER